ncbi:MAG: PKD domain-containing protein [Candidatus Ratteibacteria bacterium]
MNFKIKFLSSVIYMFLLGKSLYPCKSSELKVTLTANPSLICIGGSITFTATYTFSAPVETVEYLWSFGDGQTAKTSTSSITHI